MAQATQQLNHQLPALKDIVREQLEQAGQRCNSRKRVHLIRSEIFGVFDDIEREAARTQHQKMTLVSVLMLL